MRTTGGTLSASLQDASAPPRSTLTKGTRTLAHPQSPVEAPSVTRKGNIQVIVRVRPLSKRELTDGATTAWDWQGNHIRPGGSIGSRGPGPAAHAPSAVDGRGLGDGFHFDHLYGPEDSTERIYGEAAKGVVLASCDGYHGSVCAYGQTATGKTHTMQGTNRQPGIIPRAVLEVFDYIGRCRDRDFLLRVSYLEIYNESLNDLLSPASVPSDPRIFDDKRQGVVVLGLKEEVRARPAPTVLDALVGGHGHLLSSSTFMRWS